MKYIYSAFALVVLLTIPGVVSGASMNLSATVHTNSICGNNIKEPGEQCDGGDLGSSLCTTSGFTGGTLSCSLSCQLVFAACTTDSGGAGVYFFSAATGGEFSFSNGDNSTTTVRVPALAYPEDLTFEGFPYAIGAIEPGRPAPAGLEFVARVYSLYFLSAEGDVISQLNKPASIIAPYSDAQIMGLDPHTLTPYEMGVSDTVWHPIDGAVVDTVAHTITFPASTFGWFALFASPLPPPVVVVNNPNNNSNPSGSVVGTRNIIANGVSVSGRGRPGGRISFFIDGREVAARQVGSVGTFSFMQALSPGEYSIGLSELYANGNRSPLQNIHVIVRAGNIVTIDGITIGIDDIGEKPVSPSDVELADLSGDGLVNLVDFSILAYWYGRPHPPEKIDLNGDGKVDLIDFSIMAYYWTN